jgi:hypothetical protein
MLWSLLCGQILREGSHLGVEFLVSINRRALGASRTFGDDALAYFAERLSLEPFRAALYRLAREAKRRKALAEQRLIGLAVDGTCSGHFAERHCELCVPVLNAKREVTGYKHQFAAITVVGGDLSLPLDVEPYGEGDSELAASRRLLKRAVKLLGKRFADYVVADGLYAAAPFLHDVRSYGLRAVVRLKENVPSLLAAAEERFASVPPTDAFAHRGDLIELWDAADFDPWEALNWQTIRVIRYRQYKPDGTIVEAYWLTDFTPAETSGEDLFHSAKSRWQIENSTFNDGKNRYGLEHVRRHDSNAVIVGWLSSFLAMGIERLYRIRYLHRGTAPLRSAIELLRILRYAPLSAPDTAPAKPHDADSNDTG